MKLCIISECSHCKVCFPRNSDVNAHYCGDAGRKIEDINSMPEWCPMDLSSLKTLYKIYGLEKDENLTQCAIILKQDILAIVDEIKSW